MYAFWAISGGAVLGALARWQLSRLFDDLPWAIPTGTLLANLLGAYLAGLAFALFEGMPQLDPVWRLGVITGFLGALTTFSSFSLQMLQLLQEGRLLWALGGVCAHVCGALLLSAAGIWTVQLLRSA